MPRTRIALATLFLGLLMPSSVTAGPAEGTGDAPVYRIAFALSGNSIDLHMINSDGSSPLKVDTRISGDFRWSPDRQTLAYSHDGDNAREIILSDTSGNTTSLTDGFCTNVGSGKLCDNPRWSPSGEQVAFDAYPNLGGRRDLYVVNVETHKITKITSSGKTKSDYYIAEWSPDGSRIAFHACNPSGECRVGTVQSDGTGLKLLTPRKKGNAFHPTYNQVGSKIAYLYGKSKGDIYIMGAGGGGKKRLTDTSKAESELDWRPDGKLAYRMPAPGYTWTLWTINPNGKGKKKNQGGDNSAPDWCADESSVYVKVLDGKARLVIGDIDGNNRTVILTVPKETFVLYPKCGSTVSE